MAVLVVTVEVATENRSRVSERAEQSIVRDLGPETWSAIGADLLGGAVRGAVVLRSLSDAEMVVGLEWPGRLAVARSESLVAEELMTVGWRVGEIDDSFVVLFPPAGAVATREISAGEFGIRIEGQEPWSTVVTFGDVDLADDQLFGVFASTRLGGSSALLALSGAGLGSERVVLRNPAALGLERIDGDGRSLAAHGSARSVLCTAAGLSEGVEGCNWDLFQDPVSMSSLWRAHEEGEAAFWLLAELTAPGVDPPVWLPAGQIFEQQTFTGRQTLAIATPVTAVVSPGQRTSLLLPAFCLDRHLGPPAGDPMDVTPFRTQIQSGATQQSVWSQREAARGTGR